MAGPFVSVETRGMEAVRAIPENLPPLDKEAQRRFLSESGDLLVGEWKKTTSGPRSRRRIGVRTGALRGGIHRRKVSPGEHVVYTPVAYAAIHEFGGTIRTRRATIVMPERPHLRPAIKKWVPKSRRLYQKHIDKASRRVQARSDAKKGRP